VTLCGKQFDIAAGPHAATIVEVGARIRRYTHGGRDVTAPYGEDELAPKSCGAVLVPWPNRIRGGRYLFDGVDYQLALTEPSAGNAIHGLARWARWTAVEHRADSVTLAIDVVPQPGWPFELRAEVTYALDVTTGLTVKARATNTGRQRLPFGMGFHPYVATGTQPMSTVSVRLAAAEHIVTDEDGIPIGRRVIGGTPYDLHRGRRLGDLRLDHGYTGLTPSNGRSTVEVKAGWHGARVWLGPSFPYVQVFTIDLLAHGVGGVAVEPMTCPADAFNSGEGVVVLDPGRSWDGVWGIEPI
jgi:aldose 1-epimerase